MAVDVKQVSDRRIVHYNSFHEFLEDAERMSGISVRTLGNRSFGSILQHLALTMNGSIDDAFRRMRFPWYVRIMARLMRKKIFARGLRPGIRLPAKADASAWPEDKDVSAALEDVRSAIRRLEAETKRGSHPAFGRLSVDEWNQFHLRHCELHMSFVVPA
jgi:hypothetical protein